MKKIATFLLSLLVFSMLGSFGVVPTAAAATSVVASTNLITNPSAETTPTSGGDPVGWFHSSWGTNTPAYSVKSSAQDGTKSLSTVISTYSDGDAKWYFTPVGVTPGTTLVFSDYYKSTISTDIVAQFTDIYGNDSYQWLGTVAPTTAWTQAGYSFTVPANTKTMTVLHTLAGVGSLQTDNYSLLLPSIPVITSGVGNNSLEQVSDTSPNLPAGWQSGGWGTNNATFNYATNGYDGSRSAKTTITSYTSGDAKWYFDPIPVTPSTRYVYSDYYKSGATTRIVAQITATDGSTSYIDLGSVGASTAWKKATVSLTTPANAKVVTVLHTLATVGTLQVDLVGLVPDTVLLVTNGIGNSSLEQSSLADPAKPLGWLTGTWGTNTTAFSYASTGHTGSHAVKTQISKYTSGDSKWYYAEQPVTGGASYTFSDWYQSSISSSVVLQITNFDGSQAYMQLPTGNASTSWTQYSAKIAMPTTAKSATVLHLIAGLGTLTTDDYSLVPATTIGFNRGLVSLTFDDGWASTYTNALPILKAHNMVSTQYITTSFVDSPDYMTVAMIQAFATSGHEIGSHTVTHPDLTTLTATQLAAELRDSQAYITSHGWGSASDFASPYGAYNASVLTAIGQYYTTHRSTDVGYNSKDSFDTHNLKVQDVSVTTTSAQVDGWLDKAKTERTWLILVFHQIDNSGEPYSSTPAQLETYLTDITARGLATPTISQALAEIQPQL